MRNIFFLFMIGCCHLIAQDVYEDWAQGIVACDEKDYAKAEKYFTKAIESLDNSGDLSHPHIFVDRARLYLIIGKNAEALLDLDKALSNDQISREEKARAILSRMIARSRLGGMDQGVLEDLYAFSVLNTAQPRLEITSEKIIIRNAPDAECFKKITTCYLIHSGLCETKKDIQILSSGHWVIEKACDCGCEQCEDKLTHDQLCDACGRTLTALKQPSPLDGTVDFAACNQLAIRFAALCGNICKDYSSQAAFAAVLHNILQVSYHFCQQGGLYNRCLKPFEDSFSSLAEEENPIWD
jgi:tetratricopeptide (TPR) repeat protein